MSRRLVNSVRQQAVFSVGVISDTHGLLRPEAVIVMQGCDLIIHAGDVGSLAVLEQLGELAPVRAVRGNVDQDGWAAALPETAVVEVAGRLLYVLHDLAHLDLDPAQAGFAAVVSGHSHQPRTDEEGGVLFLNPGSAGPKRFRLPVSVARVLIGEDGLRAEIITLDV